MKQKSLTFLVILFTVCLLIFACRKEIDNMVQGRQKANRELLESAKIWYMQQLTIHGLSGPSPQWKSSWILQNPTSTIIVVPVSERYQNEGVSKEFYIFNTYDNNVNGGLIVKFASENYNISKNIDFLLRNYNQAIITAFNGYIIQSDINNKHVRGVVYEDGKENKRKTVFSETMPARQLKKGVQHMALSDSDCAEPPPPSYQGFPSDICAGGLVDIDVITVIDPDGCTISTTYKYSGHTCPGEGSGGGSGDGEDAALLAFEQDYRAQMTASEIFIYDSMVRSEQLNYLLNAQSAIAFTQSYYPNSGGHNDNADAFRHAYFSFLNAWTLGVQQAEQLGDAHEDFPGNPPLEESMDKWNNARGREAVGQWPPPGNLLSHEWIKNKVSNGLMKVIFGGQLVPSN